MRRIIPLTCMFVLAFLPFLLVGCGGDKQHDINLSLVAAGLEIAADYDRLHTDGDISADDRLSLVSSILGKIVAAETGTEITPERQQLLNDATATIEAVTIALSDGLLTTPEKLVLAAKGVRLIEDLVGAGRARIAAAGNTAAKQDGNEKR